MTALINQFFGSDDFLDKYRNNLEAAGIDKAKTLRETSEDSRLKIQGKELSANAYWLAKTLETANLPDSDKEKNRFFNSGLKGSLNTHLSKLSKDLFQSIVLDGKEILDKSFGKAKTIKENLQTLIDVISTNILFSENATLEASNLQGFTENLDSWFQWNPEKDKNSILEFGENLENMVSYIFVNALNRALDPNAKLSKASQASRNAILQINKTISDLLEQLLKPKEKSPEIGTKS